MQVAQATLSKTGEAVQAAGERMKALAGQPEGPEGKGGEEEEGGRQEEGGAPEGVAGEEEGKALEGERGARRSKL